VRGLSGTVYARLLRLRHIQLGQVTSFVLFEGSILVAVLLALADLVDPWAVAVIPVAVAIMVKLNDVVAGVLARPLAIAQLRAPRIVEPTVVGWSPVPRPARLTMALDPDDAIEDPQARPIPPPAEGVVRGVASVPPTLPAPRPEPPDASEPSDASEPLDTSDASGVSESGASESGASESGVSESGASESGASEPSDASDAFGVSDASGAPEASGGSKADVPQADRTEPPGRVGDERGRGNQGRFFR
jgi:hypothetical protein